MLLFMKVLFTQFIAEMGDKTQLMLVAMTSKFKLKDILLGTGVAVLVLNGLAVLAGGIISTVVPTWLIRLIAGAAFLFFAVTTLKGDDDEEENVKDRKIKFAPLSVFCTFFVAELGDKTQLTAITFGANEGLSAAVVVWLACSLGLFAADVIGLLIGYLLKSKAPEGILNTVAFFIFSIFGILTLRQGFGLLLGAESAMILPLTVVVLSHLWYYAYLIRNRLLEETRKDYVLLAKAKGMSRKRVLFCHCVKNIMPSFISLMAISLQHVIEGTYIVEMVFSYPGIGTLSFESAKYHDYNMLMVLCVFTGIFVIAGNVIGQSVSEWIDPRMKELKMTEKADLV